MRLVPLDADAIRALASGSPAAVDGVALLWPEEDRRVLRYRREALDADPEAAPYLLHVLLDDGRVAGRIGAHEAPVDGVAEIGYYVTPEYRGRGVATEMVVGFLDWLASTGVRRVRASVGPDNTASLAIVRRCGFEQVGERWDEEDGLELVLELPLR
jgi:[ribosomal protein S5]-alanine N-acetyltransferase